VSTEPMTSDVVREELREFIKENFLYTRPDMELRDDDDLMKLGIIDSLGFVELVEEVQDRYGIQVQDIEITEENFSSVSALVRYLDQKRSE
jgi:acyl carrier protein